MGGKGRLKWDVLFVPSIRSQSCRASLVSALGFCCRTQKFSKMLDTLIQILWWSGSAIAFGARKEDVGCCPGGRAK